MDPAAAAGSRGGGELWRKARLRFNRANGTLTAIGPGSAEAHAYAPRGEELLSRLPRALQQKVRSNEHAQYPVRVHNKEILEILSPAP